MEGSPSGEETHTTPWRGRCPRFSDAEPREPQPSEAASSRRSIHSGRKAQKKQQRVIVSLTGQLANSEAATKTRLAELRPTAGHARVFDTKTSESLLVNAVSLVNLSVVAAGPHGKSRSFPFQHFQHSGFLLRINSIPRRYPSNHPPEVPFPPGRCMDRAIRR